MYLLDTNIWLERLLEQERADDVRQLLNRIPADELIITDFSFHSIGVICHRLHRLPNFLSFVHDLFDDQPVFLFSLGPDDMARVVAIMETYALDFDDAYQYVAAEVCGADLISFDGDFKDMPRRAYTPAEILKAEAPTVIAKPFTDESPEE